MKSASRVLFSGRRALSAAPRAALKRLLSAVLVEHGRVGTVSVVFVDDEEIRRLHREYLDCDHATDVLTFPLEEADGPGRDDVLGEIFVSVDTARREADRRSEVLEREIALYALHGVLHLVGFDDGEPDARRRMRRAERKYLERFAP